MKTKNYYHILGVKQDVGSDEIKKAYRKLARQYHPDVSRDPDGENKFKEIGEAYETLRTPATRLAYDRRSFSGACRRTEDWPAASISINICWSGVPWLKFWFWWIEPEQVQDENENASTTA